jgi:hypothetical protein
MCLCNMLTLRVLTFFSNVYFHKPNLEQLSDPPIFQCCCWIEGARGYPHLTVGSAMHSLAQPQSIVSCLLLDKGPTLFCNFSQSQKRGMEPF